MPDLRYQQTNSDDCGVLCSMRALELFVTPDLEYPIHPPVFAHRFLLRALLSWYDREKHDSDTVFAELDEVFRTDPQGLTDAFRRLASAADRATLAYSKLLSRPSDVAMTGEQKQETGILLAKVVDLKDYMKDIREAVLRRLSDLQRIWQDT